MFMIFLNGIMIFKQNKKAKSMCLPPCGIVFINIFIFQELWSVPFLITKMKASGRGLKPNYKDGIIKYRTILVL